MGGSWWPYLYCLSIPGSRGLGIRWLGGCAGQKENYHGHPRVQGSAPVSNIQCPILPHLPVHPSELEMLVQCSGIGPAWSSMQPDFNESWSSVAITWSFEGLLSGWGSPYFALSFSNIV